MCETSLTDLKFGFDDAPTLRVINIGVSSTFFENIFQGLTYFSYIDVKTNQINNKIC